MVLFIHGSKHLLPESSETPGHNEVHPNIIAFSKFTMTNPHADTGFRTHDTQIESQCSANTGNSTPIYLSKVLTYV